MPNGLPANVFPRYQNEIKLIFVLGEKIILTAAINFEVFPLYINQQITDNVHVTLLVKL